MSGAGVIRLVEESDVDPMLDIYGPLVETTATSFEYQVPTHQEFWAMIINNLNSRPWLVCEMDGLVAGYAYASQHRIRAGYDWCSEVSVYIDPRFQRKGVGKALYTSLLQLLRWMGFRKAYAGITRPNIPSVEFHRSMDFQYLAVYPDIGYKFGAWHDVEWWQYHFPLTGVPGAPLRLPEIQELPEFKMALARGSTILHP